MKLVVASAVIALIGLSIMSNGLVSALAQLAAFIIVITWVLKSKKVVKKSETHIDPHV